MTEKSIAKCSMEGCEKPKQARLLCAAHLYHLKTHGDPLYQRPKRTLGKCMVDECVNTERTRGYCDKHYARMLRRGNAADPLPRTTICALGNCTKEVHSRGWCQRHYIRWYKHGDPEVTIRADLLKSPELRFWERVAITSNPDKCWEWQACVGKHGYGVLTVRQATWTSHRYAWAITYGAPTDWVLHKCDNRKCCNPNHLFQGTYLDNIYDMIAKGRAAWQKERNGNPS